MPKPLKKYQDELPSLKKSVEKSYKNSEDNFKRYNEEKIRICKSSITPKMESALEALGRPKIEFNIQEAFISRQRGEFVKHEPEMSVCSEFGHAVEPKKIETVEGIIRRIFSNARNDGTQYNIMTDALIGGFSVGEVFTEYAHEMSFDQVIRVKRVFDPCLCGADPLARTSHKGDGNFCWKLYPMLKDDVMDKWKWLEDKDINFFEKTDDGFTWSYKNEDQNVLMVCDYYKKKKDYFTIVKLADHRKDGKKEGEIIKNKSMPKKEYEEDFLPKWLNEINSEPPIIVDERETMGTIICRYIFIGHELLEYKETNFKYLPLVWCDGNSVDIRKTIGDESKQVTRGYAYHLKGAQDLKNVAGQTMTHHMEMLSTAKLILCEESLPGKQLYLDYLKNPQTAPFYVFKAYGTHKNPDGSAVQLPPPFPMQNMPLSPEVSQAFQMADQLVQTILGSYDASMGINDNQLSGVALLQAAIHSNAAAMPHIIGYMHFLNQVGLIILDLIPKYIITPRTMSIIDKQNKPQDVQLNQEGGIDLDYDPNHLNIRLEVGANFAAQRARTLQQLQGLMQASPFAAEVLGFDGIDYILDNMEMRNIEELKKVIHEAKERKKQEQQMKMQQMQQEMQNDPRIMAAQNERMRIMKDSEKDKMDNELKTVQISLQEEEIVNARLELMMKEKQNEMNAMVDMVKQQTQQLHDEIKLLQSHVDYNHKHESERKRLEHAEVELLHKMQQAQHEKNESPAYEAREEAAIRNE